MEDESLFSGGIRRRIKLNNLGANAVSLMEEILKDAKKEGGEFISISRYGKNYAGRRYA